MARKPPLTAPTGDGVTGATRASAVYEQLRADITHGVLEPGSKLRVGAMGERYGVGASPLREALSRLSAEGLVSRTDQRGFSVAALSWGELPILTRNRVQLESLALAESIEHREFHRSLLARCPSRWLRAFCDSLADEAYRFRQLAAVKVFSSRNVHGEHVGIFEAAIHGRTQEAVRLLTEHYTRTSGVVESQARELGRAA
jgi:DNA-binding GntR family transcriptional regulator